MASRGWLRIKKFRPVLRVVMLKSPLLTQSFVRLWVGNTASGLATWALPFVLGLAIVDGTLDATSAGLALAARTLGFLLAMPVSGVLSDRGGPRPMILQASLLAALGVPMVAWAMSGGALALLLIGAAIAGMGQGPLARPIRRSFRCWSILNIASPPMRP